MSRQPIGDFMTLIPHSIAPDQTLAEAHRMMRVNRIRHLPVIDGRELVGILTIGDLHLIETLRDVEPRRVPVAEAMTPDPYTVPPDEPLADVARVMAARKYGSAIVVDRGEVVGVFTTNDALNILAGLLEPPHVPSARRRSSAPAKTAPAKTAPAKPARRAASPARAGRSPEVRAKATRKRSARKR